jgi:hypothetical protein
MPTTRKTHNGSAPELTPPAGSAGTSGTASGSTTGAAAAPTLTAPPDDVRLGTVPDSAGPTLLPPRPDPATVEAAGSAAGGVTAAVWQYSKTISAIWSTNDTRNAWALVDGVGWKKIFNATDGAFTALTTLAAQARQTGRPVSFREDGGTIREIYLW